MLEVNIDGQLPLNYNNLVFRVDIYAHRTSFERMMTALLQFITSQRTRICDMLIAAGVGKVDMAVLGGDGFCADKSRLSGKAEVKPREVAAKRKSADQPGVDAALEPREQVQAQRRNAVEKPSREPDGPPPEESAEPDDTPSEWKPSKEPDGPPPEESEDAILLEDNTQMPVEEEQQAGAYADADATAESEKLIPSVSDGGEGDEAARVKANTLAVANEITEEVNMERLKDAEEEVRQLTNTSTSQQDAILNAMGRRLTIVQGPPGTGKTHTSVRILTMWAKTMNFKPLLATSHCNVAVDNIAEGLVKNGVNVCRIGRVAKVSEGLASACLENQIKEQVEERWQEAVDKGEESELEEVLEEPDVNQDEDQDEAHKQWEERLEKRRKQDRWWRKQAGHVREHILDDAEVICCTTVGSGSPALQKFKFHAILIDEVAQATEPSTLVPIVCRGAQQLVLCGDHCQLPPSVVSREAELRGMSLSLYSRLVEAGVPFRFLDTQYRANPMLMEFSAEHIYQGKLKHGVDAESRPRPLGVPWEGPECPAAFFECGEPEHLDGESKANEAEARMVMKLIEDIMAEGALKMSDIGVVTPYKGQVRTLRRVLQERFPVEIEKRELEMASVDNFQGREKELIIFSAVRCNDDGRVGFLADWRRLNVMITRARAGLVVIGNASTLICDRHWKLWLECTERQGGCREGTVHDAMEALSALGITGIPRLTHLRAEESELIPDLQLDMSAEESTMAKSNSSVVAMAKKRRVQAHAPEAEDGVAVKPRKKRALVESWDWDETADWDEGFWWDTAGEEWADKNIEDEAPKKLAKPKKKSKVQQ